MRLQTSAMRHAILVVLGALWLGGCTTMPPRPLPDVVQAKRATAAGLVVSSLNTLRDIAPRSGPRRPAQGKLASADSRSAQIAALVAAGNGSASCEAVYVPGEIGTVDGYVPPVRLDTVPLEPATIEGLVELYCVYPELYCATTTSNKKKYEECLRERSSTP